VLYRKITTFKKLPIRVPNIKTKKESRYIIIYILANQLKKRNTKTKPTPFFPLFFTIGVGMSFFQKPN